jgi:predicted RNA binding protein YcfA (HicA-like mRNA interferase family)
MSRQLPALRSAKVLKALLRAGFYIHHTKGSHHFLKHPDKPELRVTVPMHNADLKRKTWPPSSTKPATPQKSFSICYEGNRAMVGVSWNRIKAALHPSSSPDS